MMKTKPHRNERNYMDTRIEDVHGGDDGGNDVERISIIVPMSCNASGCLVNLALLRKGQDIIPNKKQGQTRNVHLDELQIPGNGHFLLHRSSKVS